MQINLLDSRIKTFIKSYLGWILFFLMVWLNAVLGIAGAGKEIKTVKVIVPTVTGKLESKKPELKPIEIKQEPIVNRDRLIYKENPFNIILAEENTKLKSDYYKMSDSLKSKAYDKAIELNTFSYKSEDKYLKLTIDGIVRGEVSEITPSYTIKEQESEVFVKEKLPGLKVLGGVEVGNTKTLDDLSFKGSVLFQNRKGNIISAGYDTDNKIWLGYYRSIF